jgi:hypothetical protein
VTYFFITKHLYLKRILNLQENRLQDCNGSVNDNWDEVLRGSSGVSVGTLSGRKVSWIFSRSAVKVVGPKHMYPVKTDFFYGDITNNKMISLKIIESLTTVYEVEQWIEIGKGIIDDSKKALLISTGYTSSHYTFVISRWETSYLPALEQQKETIQKKTRYCYGCEHMGGCLPDYDEM